MGDRDEAAGSSGGGCGLGVLGALGLFRGPRGGQQVAESARGDALGQLREDVAEIAPRLDPEHPACATERGDDAEVARALVTADKEVVPTVMERSP